MEMIIILLAAIALGVIARKWGFDSRESIDSSEWERRQKWEALH